MRKTRLARRYAQVLIAIGKEDNAHERYGQELRNALSFFNANIELYKFLLNPIYPLSERAGLIDSICEGIGAADVLKKFLALLVKRRNIKLLADIAAAYRRLEDEMSGRVRAGIEAPFPPSEEIFASVKERLEKETGKEVVLSFIKNPALIGGFIVRVGNTILDASISAHLEKMRERLMEEAV